MWVVYRHGPFGRCNGKSIPWVLAQYWIKISLAAAIHQLPQVLTEGVDMAMGIYMTVGT